LLTAAVGVANSQILNETDLMGQVIAEKLAPHDARFVVLIFAATDCPVSNRYIPEIARLDKQLTSQGVAFWWVFSNPGDTLFVVDKHNQAFAITTRSLIDSHQEMVALANVSVTPEAAVFAVKDGTLHEVYHGRIDDRYVAFGKERPQATHHDLEEAIQATLAGRPIPPSHGGPIGCSIIPVAKRP
jgi:hypothetical protein